VVHPNTEHIGYQDESIDRVLLRFLPVTLVGSKGKKVNTFALIDDGSTTSVIEKSLANELNLMGQQYPYRILGLMGQLAQSLNQKQFQLQL
jgi:predicted aspartyl protease